MPPGKTVEEIVKDFAIFFLQKINKIWEEHKTVLAYRPRPTEVPKLTNSAPPTPSQYTRK